MPFPAGWPPRPCSGRRSIRFFVSGTTTANWSDNAFLFIDDPGANTFVPMPHIKPGELTVVEVGNRNVPGSPMGTGSNPNDILPGDTFGHVKALVWANSIRIFNDGVNDIEYSFAVTGDAGAPALPVHGVIKTTESFSFRDRYEAGIALRFPGGGGASAFRIEAW